MNNSVTDKNLKKKHMKAVGIAAIGSVLLAGAGVAASKMTKGKKQDKQD